MFRGKISQRAGGRVSQALQLFARLEAHGLARWNVHFFARFRIAPDAGLPRPHAEDTEFAQFDALAAPESVLECFENGFDGLRRFLSREPGGVDVGKAGSLDSPHGARAQDDRAVYGPPDARGRDQLWRFLLRLRHPRRG